MKANSIQAVKLDIISKITATNDKSTLQKVWELISTIDTNEQKERVFNKEEKAIIKNLKKGVKEVQLYKEGKLKVTTAKDFLNEI